MKFFLSTPVRGGRNLHCQFIRNLVSDVFHRKPDVYVVSAAEQLRKKMRADNSEISVQDMGAGSTLTSNYRRRISDIAKRSAIPEKYGKLLANLSSEFGGNVIIELGTSLGISTFYLAASSCSSKVYTIEGCHEIAERAKQNFMIWGVDNVEVLEGSFDDVLPDLIKDGIIPGLVFIDGDHRKMPLLRYFGLITEVSDNNTVVILDDINYSGEMHEAWDELKKNSKVTASIDLFRFGILFFRKDIVHCDYKIRY